MPLTSDQKRFAVIFAGDGEYNLRAASADVGIPPSTALKWFQDDEFKAEVRRVEYAMLAAAGYGPMMAYRDTLALAHSDITEVFPSDDSGRLVVRDLASLPRRVRIAIKKIKTGVAIDGNGEVMVYPKEIEMYGKEGALRQIVELYELEKAPEVLATRAIGEADDTGPRRIAGLIVRPPLTHQEKQEEDLLGD